MKTTALSAPQLQNEDAAFAYVEAKLWPDGPVCPKCGVIGQAARLRGKSVRLGLWKCYACRQQFTVKMGTVFESSHVPLHIWLQVIYLMCSSKKGFSTRQIQRTLGGSMKTAWFLGHRVREAMNVLHVEPMGGSGMTVEADETFIGRKSTSRAYEPPGVKQSVFALVERGGAVRSFHVPNVTAANLRPIIAKHAHTDSRFQSDESPIYSLPGTLYAYHGVVNRSAKEYVRDDDYANTLECYFSIIKRGIYGIYQHVSEAHLHRYLAEFDFRYSNRIKLGIDDVERADLALVGAKGKRLTYRTTRQKEYARGDVTINSAEGVFSVFKRGMFGVYQHCGEQHFQRYLDEFTFRYNNRTKLGVDDTDRAERATKAMTGKRLTYRRIGGQEEGADRGAL